MYKRNSSKNDFLDRCGNIIDTITIIVIFFLSLYHWYNEVKPTNLEGFVKVIATTAISMVFVFPIVILGGVRICLMVIYLGFVIFIVNYSWELFLPESFLGFMIFMILVIIELWILVGIPFNFIESDDIKVE